MTPWLQDPDVTLYHGDVLATLREMVDESVDMVCTSPPYWGLRSYLDDAHDDKPLELGLESTPEQYVERMVEVFREVRRVLVSHGTVFLNLGDSYFSQGGEREYGSYDGATGRGGQPARRREPSCDKDDTTPQGSLERDSSSSRLCDACQEALRLRTVRSDGLLVPIQDDDSLDPIPAHTESPLDRLPTSDSAHHSEPPRSVAAIQGQRLTQDLAGAPLLASQESTLDESSPQSRDECSHCANCDVCLSVAGSSGRDARLCAHRSAGSAGTTRIAPTSADRTEDTEPSALAYLLSSIASRRRKSKDLAAIPWLVALALQADGWYLRSDIIWAKPNPMPESVTDRPTKAHEYVFLLSKQPRYFFDQEAVREPAEWARWGDQTNGKHEGSGSAAGWIGSKSKEELQQRGKTWEERKAMGFKGNTKHPTTDAIEAGMAIPSFAVPSGGRNIRSVWEIATQPYPEAHFATFPEELARRCIAAGCPEQVCRVCNAPWVREVEPGHLFLTGKGWHDHTDDARQGQAQVKKGQKAWDAYTPPQTIGFRPSCTCVEARVQGRMGVSKESLNGDDMGGERGGERSLRPGSELGPEAQATRPGIVLDPFIGSGTVAYVARKLGRHAVGIDLNESYLELAARRLQQQSLFAETL